MQQMKMASLMQEYKDYVMQQEEAGRPAMPFEEWVRSIQSPMAYGGSANPTYTQSRKQRMAYGGIAGLDGRKRYGIGSWFQEKIMDPIKKVIPNEIKNPLGALALGTAANYLPVMLPGGSNQTLIQQGIGALTETTPDRNLWDVITGQGKDPLSTMAKTGIGGQDGVWTPGGMDSSLEAAQKYLGVEPNPPEGFSWRKALATVLPGGDPGYNLGSQIFRSGTEDQANWMGPLTMGLGIGALDKATRKPDMMPQDTSGIDQADIRRRAKIGSDPGLHFLPPPEATEAYAQGGRTGYGYGNTVQKDVFMAWDEYKSGGGEEKFKDWFSDIYLPGAEAGPGFGSPQDLIEEEEKAKALFETGVVNSMEDARRITRKSYQKPSYMKAMSRAMDTPEDFEGIRGLGREQVPEELRNLLEGLRGRGLGEQEPEELPYGAAQGGRIGYRYGKSYKSKDDLSAIMKQVKELVELGLVQDEREAFELLLRSKSYGVTDEPYEFSPGAKEHLESIWNKKTPDIDPNFIRPMPEGVENIDPGFTRPMPEGWETARAQGGRIGAQEGGLMDLGGMEKDYRQEGGFVPIGGQEKADDVPARLSKNEFVFTADAVRAAGGGDIDAGAEVMENVMENLERGGQVSEESQGLEGARNMFATAQRLEGVL